MRGTVTVVQIFTAGRVGLIVTVSMIMRAFVTMIFGVIVRVAVYRAIGVAVLVFVRILVPGIVPVAAGVIVAVNMHRSVLVAVHVFVVMLVFVPVVMSVAVPVRVAMHGAVGMPMLVRLPTYRTPFQPGLTLSATAYRTHARPPRIRIRYRHARLESPADDTRVGAPEPLRGRARLCLHRITRTDCPGLALAHVPGRCRDAGVHDQPGRPCAYAGVSTSRSSTRISIPPVAWTW